MRERARQEKQKEKAARRLEAKNRKPVVPDVAPGEGDEASGEAPEAPKEASKNE
jgi:hypothetical protein